MSAALIESEHMTIREDRRPGDDDLIVELHRAGYREEGARFGASFPPYVAATVAEARLDDGGDSRVWFAEIDGRAVGCAAIVDRGDRGQLRWVVVLPQARGRGLGQRLVELAMKHAEACGWSDVFLETTDGLDASMQLYRALGFDVTSETQAELWHGRGQLIVMSKTL